MAMTSTVRKLQAVKAAHTAIWAFLASCIIAIPGAAMLGRFDIAWWASAVMAVELIVLIASGGHCPLSLIAARYTDDRRPNFDIYLPLWLARYNRAIFGTIWTGGEILFLLLLAEALV